MFILDRNEEHFIFKTILANYRWTRSFFFLLDAAATVDVLTASKDDKQTRQTRPRLLVLANFITYLPPESPRDIAFIPSIVKRVQKCRIS